jgi:hypothetical protein
VCERCGHAAHRFAELPPEYVYLLGLYLGDGCISAHRRNVFRLRIFLDLKYPEIVEACAGAMREVMPQNKVLRTLRQSNFIERLEPSNVEVSSFSKRGSAFFRSMVRAGNTTGRSSSQTGSSSSSDTGQISSCVD